MAIEFTLVCNTCKEFMDVHKLRVIPHKCDQFPLGIDGIEISKAEIDDGIQHLGIEAGNKNHDWAFALLPYIKKFAGDHALHEMRMVDDTAPDFYWWPEHRGYTAWKAVQTSLDEELFLPRNLVDDLQITEWAAAEKYLRSLQVMLYDELELDEYRDAFHKLTIR
jgi:hypothetical protein